MKKLIKMYNEKYGDTLGVIDDDFNKEQMYRIYYFIKNNCDNKDIQDRIKMINLDKPKTLEQQLTKLESENGNSNDSNIKKYVDDGITYNNKQFNNKISAIYMSRHPVSCSTEIYKKPLCDIFPELLNITYNTVFKESKSFKVNMDNFAKEYPTVKSE